MEALLLGLQSQLEDMKGTLIELKAENAILRNEILGIGASVGSNVHPLVTLEKKMLREFMREIRCDIKSIKVELQNGYHERKSAVENRPEPSEPLKISADNNENENDEDADLTSDEYPVKEIEQKTIEEERAWMKLRFAEERAKLRDPANGATLSGKTLDSISSSIPISTEASSSCVLQLSNHLNSDLTEPEEVALHGKKLSGPKTAVIRNTREAFSFQGDVKWTLFVISFRVRKDLRMAIVCWTHQTGGGGLRVGFTPEGAQIASIADILDQFTPAPDICSSGKIGSKATVEYFIIHGKLLARAHMSPGPRSVVNMEILEVSIPRTIRIPCTPNNLAGLFQITNCLTVSLKNPRRFNPVGEVNIALPMQVLPSSREILFLSHTRVAEAMFSYEIDSTDLGFLLAVRIGGNKNVFSAAFFPLHVVTYQTTFDSAMDPGQWKSHLYRKYANAQDGEQEIQIRNIRARVSMTDEDKPQFRLRIFAV